MIVVLLLVSCSKKVGIIEPPFTFDKSLLQIDSLMQRDPDSALMVLVSRGNGGNSGDDSVISTEAERSGEISSEFNTNYHSLLLSEALYKTDNPQYYRNDLQLAKHCFDSLASRYPDNNDITMLSARSHYMNGVGYYENDSVVEACKEYLKTQEIMENHFDVDKLTGYKAKFMGLTYSRLGELFFDNGVKKASVETYQTAVTYFEKVNGFCLANPIRSLALSFELDNQTDSAVFYYREAIDLAKKHNKHSVLGKCLLELAPIYYDMGNKDSAFIMARTALSLQKSEDGRLTQCYILGSLFAQECVYDSAIYYLEQSIDRDSYATKAVSAELLMKCYLALGDTVQMQYYKNIYGEKLDEYRYKIKNVHELAIIYESYKHDKLQKEHLKKLRKQSFTIIVVSFFIIITIVGIIVFVRKKIINVKKKSQYDVDAKNKALAEMKRKMEANPFMSEPICKSILETANKQQFKSRVPCSAYIEYALSKEQLLALKDAMDRHYDNFTQWICKEYPELTNDDIDYLCLYHLGLKDTDIFALMQRAYPTIGERSRKLKRIFNSNKPLHTTIKNIITLHCHSHN